MKRLFTAIILAFALSVNISAQSQFEGFQVTKDGVFKTADDKDYIIYRFDSIPAHDIYQMICANVSKVYNSPKTVMSTVEDASIAIHAHSSSLIWQGKKMGRTFYFRGYYNLLIEIREGRVKVHAPTIGTIYRQGGVLNGVPTTAERAFKDMYNKDGSIKEKLLVRKINAELFFNATYETLLGISTSAKEEDDW